MKPEQEKIFHPWYVQYVKLLPETDKPPAQLSTILANHEKILDTLTERGMSPEVRELFEETIRPLLVNHLFFL